MRVAKEAYEYGKRDLVIWQKRPSACVCRRSETPLCGHPYVNALLCDMREAHEAQSFSHVAKETQETSLLKETQCMVKATNRCVGAHYAYIHTHIHTYIHACMHTYIHTYMHTYIHTQSLGLIYQTLDQVASTVHQVSLAIIPTGVSDSPHACPPLQDLPHQAFNIHTYPFYI